MPPVTGIESFREALKGFEDCYVLIGGGACSILFDEVGSNFRATSDLDIVILTEAISGEFGDVFWSFIQDASLHLDGALGEDAQAFLEDFDDYINRETSAKKRRALAEVRATLQSVYL